MSHGFLEFNTFDAAFTEAPSSRFVDTWNALGYAWPFDWCDADYSGEFVPSAR